MTTAWQTRGSGGVPGRRTRPAVHRQHGVEGLQVEVEDARNGLLVAAGEVPDDGHAGRAEDPEGALVAPPQFGRRQAAAERVVFMGIGAGLVEHEVAVAEMGRQHVGEAVEVEPPAAAADLGLHTTMGLGQSASGMGGPDRTDTVFPAKQKLRQMYHSYTSLQLE